ncbi:MAG: 50S ribosomal protein L10 [Candidatus Nealsonbacteria bacterium RIFOXYB1_FULL_40_15]|uniref:Large ribosomal subunit protein uL10 n=2 Tax=Candidatus Nealsoniibacteriota TaxID=1817911 RepID=A0A1G2EM68_9BACT|nr:MAG: 50S ribosomal protein L10 [Candidatus Nealsonbacteria bacterium RIFOXYC1_FULL_40_7]OGZ27742.1 MAG: 50S ribosomal protein L10 [Candidatus Nealsonbacteria bacterium RIFOXYB1_FULL_40_15]
MPQTKDQKKSILKVLSESLDKQKSMVFVDYKGMKYQDLSAFRKKLKEKGCKLSVAKKTLLGLAFKKKGIEYNPRELEGQVALVLGFEDEFSPSKVSYETSKEKENLKILAGFFENNIITADDVVNLAKIPSRAELLAKVAGSLSSPVSGLVSCLHGNLRNLVYALSAIKK